MSRTSTLIRFLLCGALAVAGVCTATGAADAAATHVILSGSGGEAEFEERFEEWATRLYTALIDNLGADPERVLLLIDQPAEIIESTFKALRETSTCEDDLFVYLIGHGSHLREHSKFHIPGPDITAADLGTMLSAIPSRATAVLNSTSSSAGFINFLSGPNRIICTATKSVREINATRFMEFFIEGLEGGSADRNHDERISFLEACEQAAELTATSYVADSLIATEHALIDDNGDTLGSRLPIDGLLDEDERPGPNESATSLDGALAARCFLKDFQFDPDVPRSLIDTYTAALDDVNVLKKRKQELETAAYYAELETLLLHAAKTNRQIRTYSGTESGDT